MDPKEDTLNNLQKELDIWNSNLERNSLLLNPLDILN